MLNMEYKTLLIRLKRLNYVSYDFIEVSQIVTEFVFMLPGILEHASVGNPALTQATCPQVIRPSVPSTVAPCRDDVGHWRDQSDLLKHNSCPTSSAKL
jgi:hypothetical protein